MSIDTQPAPPVPDALPPGVHAWWWPAPGAGWGDPAAEIASAAEQGLRGLIPQAGLAAPAFCAKHGAAMRTAGLFVACGLGLDGDASDADAIVRAVLDGLDAADAVVLDWEKPRKWETPAGRDLARRVVDGVLGARPAALGRVADCPWWAPRYYVTRDAAGAVAQHATHPGAPTAILGELCAGDRYVQGYGAARLDEHGRLLEPLAAATGRSAHMLAWARDPSQYAALAAAAGLPPWRVRGAFEMYRRTAADHATVLLAEPTVALWDRREADGACVVALRCVKALRAGGYDGADAVADFQRAAGLVADGALGPATAAALGVAWLVD